MTDGRTPSESGASVYLLDDKSQYTYDTSTGDEGEWGGVPVSQSE